MLCYVQIVVSVLLVFLIVLILLIVYIIYVYNKLVTLRNRADNQFSQIDIQLKRRYELIPLLVSTVEGYAKHEKNTFMETAKARELLISQNVSEKARSAELTSSSIKNIFLIAESYPKLRANENYLKLQSQLKDTEDKIRFSRQFYNDTVMIYNNKLLVFPNNLVGKSLKLEKKEFFNAEEKEKENRKVD
jgi:LemA protein